MPTDTADVPVLRDSKIIKAAAEYAALKDESSAADKRLKQLKPILLKAMGDAPIARAGNHILRRNDVPPTPDAPDTEITKAMVGQMIAGKKGRAGYTTLEVI